MHTRFRIQDTTHGLHKNYFKNKNIKIKFTTGKS